MARLRYATVLRRRASSWLLLFVVGWCTSVVTGASLRSPGPEEAPKEDEPSDARVRVSGARCLADRAALYRLRLDTHWTRDLFPKQYPEYRPAAQWSRLVGRSHDARFSLFHVGVPAADALAAFAETGRGDPLTDALAAAPTHAVLDAFTAPAVSVGAGRTHTPFFADANHTKVSAVVRLVPSPDWFVGLDSIDLCPDRFWIESFSLQVRPLDAGSDSGFTFTAPNWASAPRQPVTRISARSPNHRAASFFYPEQQLLPAIATFRIKLEKTLRVTNEEAELSNDVVPADAPVAPVQPPTERRVAKQRRKKAHRMAAASKAGTACVAGAWGPWAPCNAGCTGEAVRERRVVRAAGPGGAPCPPLRETRLCSAQRSCRPVPFFRW